MSLYYWGVFDDRRRNLEANLWSEKREEGTNSDQGTDLIPR